MDDSSSEGSTISRINTKATAGGGEWKVSEDGHESVTTAGKSCNKGSAASGGQTRGRTSTTSELLRMSHSGYSAPVNSWNGNRAQLDREINNEKREDRKRALSSDSIDAGRVKHVRTNNGNSHNKTNPGYNPVQVRFSKNTLIIF